MVKIKAMLDTYEYQHLNNVCAEAMLNKFCQMRELTEWNGLEGFGKYNNRDVQRQFNRLVGLGYLRYKTNIDVYEFWGNPTACLEVSLI